MVEIPFHRRWTAEDAATYLIDDSSDDCDEQRRKVCNALSAAILAGAIPAQKETGYRDIQPQTPVEAAARDLAMAYQMYGIQQYKYLGKEKYEYDVIAPIDAIMWAISRDWIDVSQACLDWYDEVKDGCNYSDDGNSSVRKAGKPKGPTDNSKARVILWLAKACGYDTGQKRQRPGVIKRIQSALPLNPPDEKTIHDVIRWADDTNGKSRY
ncbi:MULTISPECIES: hypothetical protein [unclassified Methylococcus]|uniref:hypothetical protein n=1 Tax=unclassified Methylococcus TaxID=2618889 RepID=UPI003D7E95BA